MFNNLPNEIKAEVISYLEINSLINLLKVYKFIKLEDSVWYNVINILNLNNLLKRDETHIIFRESILDYYDIYMQYLVKNNNNRKYWRCIMKNYSYYEDVKGDDDINNDINNVGYAWSNIYYLNEKDFYVEEPFDILNESIDKIIREITLKIYYNYVRYKFYELKTSNDDSLFDGKYSSDDYFIKYLIIECHYNKKTISYMKEESYNKLKFISNSYLDDMSAIIFNYIKSKLLESIKPDKLSYDVALKLAENCNITFSVEKHKCHK